MPNDRRQKEQREIKYADAKQIAEKQQAGFTPVYVKLPKGIKSFSFKKEGIYRLRVFPFPAGKGNPMADEGFYTYERTIFVHQGLGIDGKQKHACAMRVFGNKCAVHDSANELKNSGASAELVKELEKTSKRQLMVVVDLDDLKDKKRGITKDDLQVYEGPYHFGLGELIDNKIDASREGSPYRNFYHMKGGQELSVKVGKTAFKSEGKEGKEGFSGTFNKPINLEMEPGEDLDAELLEFVPCLDECVQETPYKKLKDLVTNPHDEDEGDDDKEDDEDQKEGGRKKPSTKDDNDDEPDYDGTPPKKPVSMKPSKDDDDDDDEPEEKEDVQTRTKTGLKLGDFVTYKGVEYEIKKISPDGTSLVLEDEDEDIVKAVDAKKVTKVPSKDDEPDDDDDPPPVKKPSASKKPSKDDDNDEDDNPLSEDDSDLEPDDDDDDLPAPPKKPGKK